MITTLNSIVNTLCSTGVVDFPANYKITNKDHVFVYYVDGEVPELLLTQVSSFTAGSPNEYKINAITESGFNVELRDAYDTATGRKISIRRVLPLTQETDYPPGNDFPASTHERALDKLTAIIQQFSETISRQIGIPLSEDAEETTLPAYIPNYYLGLDGLNNLIWKVGTVAVGNDEIKDSHIDWGTAAEQVSAVDMPIADAGGIITAVEVEGALQETKLQSDTHKTSDGKDHSDVVLNNTHRVSDGSDHTFIDQDVKTTSSPVFNGVTVPVMLVQDQKVNNTPGGTFTSGAWRTRDLNTEVTNTISGASLVSNQITLPAGIYKITASAPAYLIGAHKIKFYDVTNTTDIIIGTSEVSSVGTGNSTRSFLTGIHTVTAPTVFELQHICSTTQTIAGYGDASNFSVVEVFSDVFIEKIG